MIEFLTYDLKVAALLAIFYMFYRLMLAHETFHRVNRVVLLLTAVASFVLPLCVITMHETVTLPMPSVDMAYDLTMPVADSIDSQAPWWHYAVIVVFIAGLVATLGHTMWSLFRIVSLIRKSEKHPQNDGTIICVTENAELAPFSWMYFIVMNRDDYEEQNAAILTHERGHIRLHHSWDLLLVDSLTALQWFNPTIWMLRSDLRAIHEYEADGAVLSQGINARQYQYLLITKAASIGGYSLANGISHSTLKNRINMMLHTKTPRQHYLKLLALLPIVAVALAVNAETVTDYVFTQPQQQTPIKKGNKAGAIKVGNKSIQVMKSKQQTAADASDPQTKKQHPYHVVEHMPSFPGGTAELFKFLATTVKYPAAAKKAGTQGRVIVTFVVEEDGSIVEPTVVKSVSPELDAEAVRVINAMPNWEPGTQNGKAVRVKYTIPIIFSLSGSHSTSTIPDGNMVGGPSLLNEMMVVGYGKGDEVAAEKHPLVIVDGKTVDYAELEAIDSHTIDHMEILKNKSAVEKYGEKAQYGAILISTKKK